ncbi:hypothetical protein KP509_1Z168700 [Ceratopteris richardii]|nr:hypothetical protein KP509_1Z168700 [Ceratopteris richardii]
MIEILAPEISHAITSPEEWAPGLREKLQECRIPFTLVQAVLRELQEEPLKALSFFRFIRRQPNHRKNVCLYESMLYILRKARMLGTIWHLRDDMIMEGIPLSFNSYEIIMWSYGLKQMSSDAITTYESMVTVHGHSTILLDCLLLVFLKSGEHGLINAYLKNTRCPLDASSFAILIKSMCLDGQLDNAIDCVETMKEAGHQLETRTCDTLVRALSSAGRTKDALRFLQKNEINLELSTFRTLISGFCRNGDTTSALEVLAEMKEHGFKPCASSYKLLIGKLCESGSEDMAMRVLEEMISFSINPALFCFHVIMIRFCDKQDLQSAQEVLDKLIKCGLHPSLKTLSILLDGHCKAGDMNRAFQLLQEMTDRGFPCDAYVYTTVMNGCFRNRDTARALSVFNEMKKKGCVITVATYNVFMTHLCESNKPDEAERMLLDMESQQLFPDSISYNIILRGLLKTGHALRAFNVFKTMSSKGYMPVPRICKDLLKQLCLANQLDYAETALELMTTNHAAFGRNLYGLYDTVFDGLCSACKFERAMFLLEEMSKLKLYPDAKTYTIFMKHLCKAGRVVEARTVLDRMADKDCIPDVYHYTILIDGYCKNEELPEAFELLDEMRLRGCIPTVTTYNALMKGLCEAKDVDEALRIFSSMIAEGLCPDSFSYSILIHGLCKSVRIVEALELLNEMRLRDVIQDSVVFNPIIKALCESGKLEAAAKLLDQMVMSGCALNFLPFQMLVDGLTKVGHLDEAFRLYITMVFQYNLHPDLALSRVLIQGLYDVGKSREANIVLQQVEAKFGIQSTTILNRSNLVKTRANIRVRLK